MKVKTLLSIFSYFSVVLSGVIVSGLHPEEESAAAGVRNVLSASDNQDLERRAKLWAPDAVVTRVQAKNKSARHEESAARARDLKSSKAPRAPGNSKAPKRRGLRNGKPVY